jgi:2-methylfumaryl-CoA isomerase
MSAGILAGLSVVEGSAFVAAPLGGMLLAQLGADVIRIDPLGGGLDHRRWPLAPGGASLFWAGLNKAKRSIRLDLGSDEGQQIAARLVTRPGPEAGIFLTNLPQRGRLGYAALKRERADVIVIALTGNADGTSAVDYTVNPATGFAMITGPAAGADPVNSALPAWDIAFGEMAALGLLAAERHRSRTGEGNLVRLALSDVAFAMAANLGRLGAAELGNEPPRDGNFLHGAFGHDFQTADGRRVMVVGLTGRQWRALKQATDLDEAALARQTQSDLSTESGRYAAREAIRAALAPWFAARPLAAVRRDLDAAGVAWGPYQTFGQALAEDPRASPANPMFGVVRYPGIGELLTPASPLDFSAVPRLPPKPAPVLGADTDTILGELGYSQAAIGSLHDRGIVAGPEVG